jgi:hypothetical protein
MPVAAEACCASASLAASVHRVPGKQSRQRDRSHPFLTILNGADEV